MPKSRLAEKQISLRADAARFFDWCRFNLRHYVEKRDAWEKNELDLGKIPKELLDEVRPAWSRQLKQGWPPEGTCAVAAKVLKNPDDLEAWKNCLYGQEHQLPKRIRAAVFNALKKRGEEINTNFFANDGDKRLIDYLRVWQSQKRALDKMTLQALGWKYKPGGGASFGSIPVDVERMFLSDVEATGTANVRGLFPFVVSLWEAGSPHRSETRLNRFLVKLGRSLACTKKRGQRPDWLHSVDQTERFVVEGWCESITVDEETWPPLCFLTTPALVRFLRLCNVKHCKLARNKDARSIERAIQRLGLVRIPQGRLKHVEKRGGGFYFT